MTKKIKLASITSKWMGTPYKEHGNNPKEGCDCFSFILNILEDYGYKLPDKFEGLTRNSYVDLWYSNRKKALKTIENFLLSITIKKKITELRSGDIIFVNHKKLNEKSFMLYAGNSKAIIVNPKFGVIAMPIREVDVISVYKGYH